MKKILDLIRNVLNETTAEEGGRGIDMHGSEPKLVNKLWGYEIWMANDEVNNYCGKILHMNKGHRFSMHFHRDKHETFYILKGRVKLTIIETETSELVTISLEEGECYVIDRLVPHQVEALEETDIIESSTYHRDEDSYRVWRDQSITYSI